MTEEIKEILDYIDDRIIPNEHWNKVKDYIINLQHIEEQHKKLNGELRKENKKLKEELKNRPIVDFTFDVYKELEDYKSRCEKAIEYIEKEDWNTYYDKKLLNILNGDDEE